MLKLSRWFFPVLLVCLVSGSAAARSETEQAPTIAEKTAGAQKLPGDFNLYWDAKHGKVWLEIEKWSAEFLYQSGLPAGIGSNDIEPDRVQREPKRTMRVERRGPQALPIHENR